VHGRSYDILKRVGDVLVAGVLLVLTAPVQALVAVLVRRRLGSPVLFRQPRPGKDGKVFELVKFRTMRAPDPSRSLVTDAERLTPIGAWLRSTSLDELPTLWNVLRGDMSLVGPRPLLVQYLDRYTPDQARRHEVRPGVTGLAQISGRNEVEWGERLRLDVEYVDQRSLRLDARILAATLMLVVRRHGVSGAGSVTMTEFGVDDEHLRRP
jgi:lipopolysaccharide/colanic/teichoic acid biosynthesis glycosyltransferase